METTKNFVIMENLTLISLKLKIGKYKGGRKYGVFAGKSLLGGMFNSALEAEMHLKNNVVLYKFWSESVSVSSENSKKVIIYC